MTTPCEQEANIAEIKLFMRDLAIEIKDLVRELRAAAVDDRETRTRIMSTEKDVTVLYKRVRRIEDEMFPKIEKDINDIDRWKNRIDGGFKALMIAPSVISILSALIAWFAVNGKP